MLNMVIWCLEKSSESRLPYQKVTVISMIARFSWSGIGCWVLECPICDVEWTRQNKGEWSGEISLLSFFYCFIGFVDASVSAQDFVLQRTTCEVRFYTSVLSFLSVDIFFKSWEAAIMDISNKMEVSSEPGTFRACVNHEISSLAWCFQDANNQTHLSFHIRSLPRENKGWRSEEGRME